jgi:hypothetical protein
MPSRSAMRPATSSSPARRYLPPQPLKAKPTATGSPDSSTVKTGPVSRSQMSPNGMSMTSGPRPVSAASALRRASGVATRTRSSSPRRTVRFGSGSVIAWKSAATSPRAGSRSSPQRSGWLGHADQTARCGAHSGGGGTMGDGMTPATLGRASAAGKPRRGGAVMLYGCTVAHDPSSSCTLRDPPRGHKGTDHRRGSLAALVPRRPAK